ncbi:MAG: nucleotide pyrophosphatase/phosphodiesterase family protein [Isosphaeraceae bacterium]
MLAAFAPIMMLLAAANPAAEPQDRHVLVISIDGLPGSYLNDPQASLPVIRGLAKSGVVATRGMLVSNPSVTWPNHTTLMTGVHPEGHGVLANGILERQGVDRPIRVVAAKEQSELVHGPLLFDTLKETGLTSTAINWPCTRGSTSLVDNFPDVPDQLSYTTPRLKQELTDKGLLQRFSKGGGPVRDEVWTEAACQSIRERKPNLIVLHLLNLDSIHHRHGPQTPEGYTAAALADARVGQVVQALDDAGIRERTTVFVVSDHGFAAVTKALNPNALLRREGLLKLENGRITSAKVHVVPEGGVGLVYLTDPKTADEDRETVRRLFQDAEGIEAIIEPKDYSKYHFPQPDNHQGMADLVLAAKNPYAFSGDASGDTLVTENKTTTGTHGYLSTNPKMNATFVASGAGIKPGATLSTVENTSVAPTVAKLLGVPLKQATGTVLNEVLIEP